MPLLNERPSGRPRVVVTGMGATTPLGGSVPASWSAILDGESGITKLDWTADYGLPVHVAAPLAVDPAEVLGPVQARRLDRYQQAALVASREAWADAGFTGRAGTSGADVDPDRVATVIGTGIGGAHALLAAHDTLHTTGPDRVSPRGVPQLMPNGGAGAVSIDLGARRAALAPTSACAAGADALIQAKGLIEQGQADVVIAGGADAPLAPVAIALFHRIRALSQSTNPESASRPFDAARDGFVMGEGAGTLILESEEHALARGARIHATFAGAGCTADAKSPTDPDPDGQVRAINLALADADMSAADIDHVNAHATSTPRGDQVEAQAIRTALGDGPLVTATKSYTGHLIGAAGAVEAIWTILAIQQGVVPRVRTLERLDPAIEVNAVRDAHHRAPVRTGLSSSFGFGGHNMILVFEQADQAPARAGAQR